VFVAGVLYRVGRWFAVDLGDAAEEAAFGTKLAAGLSGVLGTVFSGRIIKVVGAFFRDVLFQARILSEPPEGRVWVMHFLIFVGFTYLLLFHALGDYIAPIFSSDYESTRSPWLTLRDVFGLILAGGLAMAVVRRFFRDKRAVHTGRGDVLVLVLLGGIVVSGFLLQAVQISAPDEFSDMVDEYAYRMDPEDVDALRAYWVEHYGLSAAGTPVDLDADRMEQAEIDNQDYCMYCHAKPRAAFISHGLSKFFRPADGAGLVDALYFIHYIFCFIGLAYLPFSKMWHVFATPVSLLNVSVGQSDHPARAAVGRVVEKDGCAHGGRCHENCPVYESRLRRIEIAGQFEPVLDYADQKDNQDLAARSKAY
jgi:nitrate reductase gamma subunit